MLLSNDLSNYITLSHHRARHPIINIFLKKIKQMSRLESLTGFKNICFYLEETYAYIKNNTY